MELFSDDSNSRVTRLLLNQQTLNLSILHDLKTLVLLSKHQPTKMGRLFGEKTEYKFHRTFLL